MQTTTNPAVQLHEIGQIALTVTNLDDARAFYRDILGMQFLFDAGAMIFFQCGSVRLLLGTGENHAAPGGGTVLYFRVPDIQAACTALREKGVGFSQEPHLVARMKSHDLWLAIFNDPAGNALALMSEIPRASTPEKTA
jgi:methylmalonyl-CoA/ethylmalonyl-CoA epimerase